MHEVYQVRKCFILPGFIFMGPYDIHQLHLIKNPPVPTIQEDGFTTIIPLNRTWRFCVQMN